MDSLELARLLLCGIGTTWICPAPVFDTWMIGGRPVLDTKEARAWSCATDVGGGWIDDVPVVRGVTHDGRRYVLIGGEVLIERDAARTKSAPALPTEVRVVESALVPMSNPTTTGPILPQPSQSTLYSSYPRAHGFGGGPDRLHFAIR